MSGRSDTGSYVSYFPWNPAEGQQPAGYYHAKTALKDGRTAALMDSGAFTNLGGGKAVRAHAAVAKAFGHETTQRRMKEPLYVSGLGNGVKKAEWEVSLPIALPDEFGGATLHHIVVPVLDNDPTDRMDTSADLPIIQGSRSLEENCAVIEMTKEGKKVTFPGPGGYKIVWAPGAITVPLERAQSGHPMMPIWGI